MKKIKRTQANGFYIFRGEVAANSNFIETLEEAKQFLIYANFFLKAYMTVYDYNITRHEWHMIVKLKSKEQICGADYEKEDSCEEGQVVWRVISERIRLFLSRYVVTVNRMRGRTGTLVHSSYERYFFETLEDAKTVVESIRQQTFRMYRRKPKYRGLKSHYKIPKRLGKGSIFLCSREVLSEKRRGQNFLENQYLSDVSDLVLLKWMKFTIKQHSPSSKSPFYNKLE